jgi:hypothetical protein
MRLRSRLMVVGAALIASFALGSAAAEATLVPAELRLGESPASPLVPLTDSTSSDPTVLKLRVLPGQEPKLELPGNVTLLTCPPYPPEYASTVLLRSNGPVEGDNFRVQAGGSSGVPPCHATLEPQFDIAVELEADGRFQMRAESPRRSGLRDGVLEPRWEHDGFEIGLRFVDRATGADGGRCVYGFTPPTRIDVFNPGRGHKIDFERERVELVDHYPDTTPYPQRYCPPWGWFSAEVRLRAYTAQPGGAASWTSPVWLLPKAG